MDARHHTRGQRWVIAGLATQAVAIIAIKSVTHPSPLGLGAAILAMLGTAAYMIGLAYYAKAKGYRAAWCVLGLFSLLGLTIILSLPDLE